MSLKNDRYTYRVTWSEDDNEYVGLCAEFHSLSWLAKTPEAALKGIRKVVADIVNDMQSTGETIPAPISLNIITVNFRYTFLRGAYFPFIAL
jgi:predicted RNase H-like HicB family nuclease